MKHDHDDEWLQALAGRDDPARRSATLAEARLLRAALGRIPAPPLHAPAPEQLQQLLAALAAQDAPQAAAGARRCIACAERWRAWTAWWRHRPGAALGSAAALATLVVASALGVRTLAPESAAPEAAPAWRGPGGGARVIADAQPEQTRNALARELGALGAQVQRYERLGRFGLQARLPQPAPAALTALLAERSLQAPPEGLLIVEFEATP